MGVNFVTDPNDPEAIYWKRTIDTYNKNEAIEMGKAMLQAKNEQVLNKGWSKNRDMKWMGQIPQKVWFEMMNQHGQDYWHRDNKRNIRKWLNDHPHFRIEDHRV